MQVYNDPKRESETYALPDIEVWEVTEMPGPHTITECGSCGCYHRADYHGDCRSDSDRYADHEDYAERNGIGESEVVETDTPDPGWYWWSCFPGCLPDGEPMGPFETEAEALADAREGIEDEPLPLCVQAMRCYCAGHARGNPASEPCDTSE